MKFAARESNYNSWMGIILGWVVPLLILFSIWGFLLNRIRGSLSALKMGKSKARIYSEGSTSVKFIDVAGVDEAKTELQEIVDFLNKADKLSRF